MTTLPSVDPKGHILTAEHEDVTRGRINTLSQWNQTAWMAWRDTDEPEQAEPKRYGFGNTEREAIADLLEQERQ